MMSKRKSQSGTLTTSYPVRPMNTCEKFADLIRQNEEAVKLSEKNANSIYNQVNQIRYYLINRYVGSLIIACDYSNLILFNDIIQ